MAVKDFLNLSVISKRKTSGSGAAVEPWETIIATLKCSIFPASPGDVVAFQSPYLRTSVSHKMYCRSDEDIKIDDKIVDGDDEYLVKRFMKWDHSGISFYKIYLSEIR